MKFVDLHEDLAYSNQMGIDVIEGDHQSSLKLLRNFDSLVFGSLFPHVNTRDERSDLLTSMYGYTTHSTTFSWELLMDQIKFYLYLERKGLVKVIRSREDLSAPVTKLLLS
ncbi:MAG: peptidase, partial [Metallosphaera sp.]